MTPASAQAEAIHDLYMDVMTILVAVTSLLVFIFVTLLQRPEVKTFSFITSDHVKNIITAKRPYLAYTHNTALETV